ncbi:MAG: hypothetical protein ACXVHB_17625 [Solirubrobacteraceae bacterium]
MPIRLATGALLVVVLAVVATPALGAAAGPTPNQIKSAVHSAERSKRLWATINVCDTRKHPHTIGIRGEVPALGFPATISISIGVDFYSKTDKRFEPDPDASKMIKVGPVSHGIHQRGVTFRFAPHTGRLRGTATFSWTRRGKVLGSTKRVTTPRHPDADFGDPSRFSAATCMIK